MMMQLPWTRARTAFAVVSTFTDSVDVLGQIRNNHRNQLIESFRMVYRVVLLGCGTLGHLEIDSLPTTVHHRHI